MSFTLNSLSLNISLITFFIAFEKIFDLTSSKYNWQYKNREACHVFINISLLNNFEGCSSSLGRTTVQLYLLFLHWCVFFLCSSCWKLEFLLVPIPSPLLASSSSYQTYHIITPPPFNEFLSYLLLFHSIKFKFLICISCYVLFLFTESVAFLPFCPWW